MRAGERLGHRRRLQQFQLNIEAAERTEALKLEVTAPTIASRPRIATQAGATCLNIRGRTSEALEMGRPLATAEMPISSGGITKVTVNRPEYIDMRWASRAERQERTRWK